MRARADEGSAALRAARAALGPRERIVLAVSGGQDSMVLLHAAGGLPQARTRVVVATFDHRSGPHSARASQFVARAASRHGFRCVVGTATGACTREHEWREERWRFLRAIGREFSAPVATAHTRDDQVETVFIRILRDAGARGLAGLYADSDVIRPFIGLCRTDLAEHAALHGVRHVEDPSNVSRAHLRNRVRHELLPAIERIRPDFPGDLLEIATEAARWRDRMRESVGKLDMTLLPDGSLRVARGALAGYDAESLRALWPAMAAEVGVVMDRRGTHRAAEFTMKGRTGGSIQLSGGVEIRMFRDHLLLRKWDVSRVEALRSARLDRSRGERRAELA